MKTKTVRNSRESVRIIMDGEALGVCKGPTSRTAVRKTACGRFAVVNAANCRLIRVLTDELHARRYNFAIHGRRLGV